MAADDPHADLGDLLPRPDPTRLTTDQLRREMSALREILTARLDGMDRATTLLSETVNRTPTVIQTEIAHVRELVDERFRTADRRFVEADLRYQQRFDERDLRFKEEFGGVQLQFQERDVRTGQAATASAQALAAALQAAKEAVFEQAQAAAKAAEKTELSFSKQIEQIQLQIRTVSEGLGDKIDDLKGRIDRGEGNSSGRDDSRAVQRITFSQVIAVAAVLATVASLIVLALKK